MKSSIYTVGLASVILSIFTGTAQADGVTYVKLSTTPIAHMNKRVHYVHPRKVCPQRVCVSRVHKKQTVKASLRAQRKARAARIARAARSVRAARENRNNPARRYYYVQNGDNLYTIAKKCKVSVKHIQQTNKLRSSVIKVGIRLQY